MHCWADPISWKCHICGPQAVTNYSITSHHGITCNAVTEFFLCCQAWQESSNAPWGAQHREFAFSQPDLKPHQNSLAEHFRTLVTELFLELLEADGCRCTWQFGRKILQLQWTFTSASACALLRDKAPICKTHIFCLRMVKDRLIFCSLSPQCGISYTHTREKNPEEEKDLADWLSVLSYAASFPFVAQQQIKSPLQSEDLFSVQQVSNVAADILPSIP